MTERQKMLVGKLYDPLDSEFVAARERARDLCQNLNATRESTKPDRCVHGLTPKLSDPPLEPAVKSTAAQRQSVRHLSAEGSCVVWNPTEIPARDEPHV